MAASIDPTDRAALEGIVAALESAWNAGDGKAFSMPFTADADFVTIRAEHFSGRAAIAAGHATIFHTIYAGSVIRYVVESARLLCPEVALIHVQSVLEAPSGPLAGRHNAMFSAVVVREATGWHIAALHNTLAPSAGTRP